jgi:hypothetical protein
MDFLVKNELTVDDGRGKIVPSGYICLRSLVEINSEWKKTLEDQNSVTYKILTDESFGLENKEDSHKFM